MRGVYQIVFAPRKFQEASFGIFFPKSESMTFGNWGSYNLESPDNVINFQRLTEMGPHSAFFYLCRYFVPRFLREPFLSRTFLLRKIISFPQGWNGLEGHLIVYAYFSYNISIKSNDVFYSTSIKKS